MSKVLYWILQLTWGLPQTIVGFIVFILNIRKKHYLFNSAVATEWDRDSGVSLGLFIFIPKKSNISKHREMLFHEYGHTIQSLILGPIYLLVIGIPSIVWFNVFKLKASGKKAHKSEGVKNKTSYTDFYTEKWAENVGNNRRIRDDRGKIPMKK